jgi:hypothetical protein
MFFFVGISCSAKPRRGKLPRRYLLCARSRSEVHCYYCDYTYYFTYCHYCNYCVSHQVTGPIQDSFLLSQWVKSPYHGHRKGSFHQAWKNRPRLKESALLRIPELNRGLEAVNSYFASTHERNCTVFKPEVAGMKDGMSRSFQWMLFLSLMPVCPVA